MGGVVVLISVEFVFVSGVVLGMSFFTESNAGAGIGCCIEPRRLTGWLISSVAQSLVLV